MSDSEVEAQIVRLLQEKLDSKLSSLEKANSEQIATLTVIRSNHAAATKIGKDLSQYLASLKAFLSQPKGSESLANGTGETGKSKDDLDIKKDEKKGLNKNASVVVINSKKPANENGKKPMPAIDEKKGGAAKKPAPEKKPDEKKPVVEKKPDEKKSEKKEPKPAKPAKEEEKKPDEKKPAEKPAKKEPKKPEEKKKDEKEKPKKPEAPKKDEKKVEKPAGEKKETPKPEKKKPVEKKPATAKPGDKEKAEKPIAGKKKEKKDEKKDEKKEAEGKKEEEKKEEKQPSDEKTAEQTIEHKEEPHEAAPEQKDEEKPSHPPVENPPEGDEKKEEEKKEATESKELIEEPNKEKDEEVQANQEESKEPEKKVDSKLLEKKDKYTKILEVLASKELKNVPPYEQPFSISESAMGAVEFVDIFFEEAFLGHESFDEKIIRLFQAFFLVENVSYPKDASNEEMTGIIKKYIGGDLKIRSQLGTIGHRVNLDIKRKIRLEKIVDQYNFVISPSTYDSLDALSSVVAFVLYDVCEYLGVLKEDIVENKELALLNKPPAERIAIFNYEKQQHYLQKVSEIEKKLEQQK